MNRYEPKQEARRERYEARAEKARAEAEARHRRSMEGLPPWGEPIKVGCESSSPAGQSSTSTKDLEDVGIEDPDFAEDSQQY